MPEAQRRAAEQALNAIHEAGVLHGDVRWENLIFEEGTGNVRGLAAQQQALFLDLGFSKASCTAEDSQQELKELRKLLTLSPTGVRS